MTQSIRLLHQLRYELGEPAGGADLELRLRPRVARSHQLVATPAPVAMERHTDAFGDAVVTARFGSLRALTLTAVSIVETAALRQKDERPGLEGDLAASRLVEHDERLAEVLAGATTPESVALAVQRRLRFAAHERCADASALATLSTGRGVCQDFAHVALGALRSRGVPARYVGGYLLPSAPRHLAQPHAWVAMWCADRGWVELDPTLGALAGDRHVTVAAGRDYDDAASVRGEILTACPFRLRSRVTAVEVRAAGVA